ncbi:MAG: transposase [Acidimicrobiales bacterium]
MSLEKRYPSDLTDLQWALVEPLLSPAMPGGRPEDHPRIEIVNAIQYLVRTGCSWRQPPINFPPWETVYWHFKRWRDDGSLDALHNTLRGKVRVADDPDETPNAAIIDSQSIKATDTVPAATRGI